MSLDDGEKVDGPKANRIDWVCLNVWEKKGQRAVGLNDGEKVDGPKANQIGWLWLAQWKVKYGERKGKGENAWMLKKKSGKSSPSSKVT